MTRTPREDPEGQQPALADVARMIAPEGAAVHHLCAVGVGTFSVATQEPDRGVSGVHALKVVVEPPTDAARSPLELDALRSIEHPHLVRYRDTGTKRHENQVYRWLAMDFVDGSTLAQLLADGAAFDVPTAVRIVRQAVSGAAALWEASTTHRDLVADNVMITPSGDAVVVDLGFARQGDGWRSDQFDLGLIGYRLITGVDAVVHPQADELAQTPGTARLWRALATMTAPRAQDRFENPADLLAELETIADTLGPASGPGIAPPVHGLTGRVDA